MYILYVKYKSVLYIYIFVYVSVTIHTRDVIQNSISQGHGPKCCARQPGLVQCILLTVGRPVSVSLGDFPV